MHKLLKEEQVSPISIINELETHGYLKPLFVAGLFPAALLRDVAICRYVTAKQEQGVAKTKAVSQAAEDFKVCEDSVFKILRRLA